MRPYRHGGRACARRLVRAVFIVATLAFASGPVTASTANLDGIVVDQNGRPLARAHVRVIREDGGQRSEGGGRSSEGRGQRSEGGGRSSEAGGQTPGAAQDVFTDESGRFSLSTAGNCRVEATLAGFRPATVACDTAGALRIELALAPIEETVIVTATRTEVPASQTGVSATTFTAAEIERRQAPLVSDLLRTTPGAVVLQTGAPGGVTGLFVRGGESNYNMVMLDGVPLNEPGGAFNFNNLTTENLERVEVVRGANSALFGSDAMSSVVQLFTKRGTARSAAAPTLVAQIDGGSYGTMHASASASGVARQFDYGVTAARFSTDNRVPNSGFDNTTVSANLGAALGANTTLRGVVRGELGTTGTAGQTAYGRPDLDAFYEHDDVVGGVTFDQQVNRTFRQHAAYSLSSSRQASTNLVEDAPYTPSYEGHVAPFEFYDFTFDSHTTLRRHYASYQADWHVAGGGSSGDHRFTALADWNGERARLDDRMSGDQQDASRDNLGASVQHQMLWRRLSTTAGARVERNDSFGTAVVPRGSAVVTVHRGTGQFGDTRVHAAAGLGIKEPTLLQTFSTSPYFMGNPDLQPERSRAVEAGVEQRVAGDRAKLEATWFDNRYRDIIGLRSTGGYTSEYFNIGLTSARGLELGAEIAPQPSIRVRAGYTFTDSAILESTSEYSPVFAAGQWAFRRPRHSGFVQGSWTWQRLTADLSGVVIGRYVDSDFSALEPPILENAGRTTWDARMSYRVTSKVMGLLMIDNLTGLEYQEPLGYQALQRAVRVGLRVGF